MMDHEARQAGLGERCGANCSLGRSGLDSSSLLPPCTSKQSQMSGQDTNLTSCPSPFLNCRSQKYSEVSNSSEDGVSLYVVIW